MNRVQKVEFGTSWEMELMPRCMTAVGEDLKKTTNKYDTMDFEGESCYVELKVRTKQYWPCQFANWLMPYCKIQRAKEEKKKVFFFYYWISTKQMFAIQYDEKLFDSFTVDVPEWKDDKQLQIYIPRELWKEI